MCKGNGQSAGPIRPTQLHGNWELIEAKAAEVTIIG
jgi:hypothetical protein